MKRNNIEYADISSLREAENALVGVKFPQARGESADSPNAVSRTHSGENSGVSTCADAFFMRCAVSLAEKSAECGEVPVGCVIVRGGEIISCAGNSRESDGNALSHAEIRAINASCAKTGSWRLDGCTLYVTLEPCLMCAGAVVNARIPRVVTSLRDANSGAMGSLFNVSSYPVLSKPRVVYLPDFEDEIRSLMRGFFAKRRK